MDTVRDVLLKHLGAGILGGATSREWRALLRENGYRISPHRWPRALHITLASLANAERARREEARHGEAIDRTPVPPPLFILGAWRCGTTHLHNLLCRDRRFAYPTLYEVLHPHTFLGDGTNGVRALDRVLPRTRMMDGMRQGVCEPQEEEIALAGSGVSAMLGLVFPRARDRYWRYVTLEEVTPAETERWRMAYLRLVRKLAYAKGRPLVLKSPANSGRIRLLVEMFPGARFVHIHRHPYAVFQSVRHAWRATMPWWSLQGGELDDRRIMRDYAELYDAYLDQRGLIPAGHLCEVAFADLERDPVAELARVYASLSLPDFAVARPEVQRYTDSLTGYRRNHYSELAVEIRVRLLRYWWRVFREWGYRG